MKKPRLRANTIPTSVVAVLKVVFGPLALALVLDLGGGVAIAAADSPLDKIVEFNIPTNTALEDALIEWGTSSGMAIMMNTSWVPQRPTQGLRGRYSARWALVALLRDSGLTYTEDGGRVRITPAEPLVRSGTEVRERLPPTTLSDDATGQESSNGRKGEESETQRTTLSEVIVTAQKHEELLQDVPIPVAVVDTEKLTRDNQVSLQDYYMEIPGLSISIGQQSQQSISIRGLTVGGGTTGVTIDDVPLGAGGTGSGLATDLDPGDLARIEVLAGPQGTLYGANSMGGLVRYVLADPSTTRTSGEAQVGINQTYNSGGLGYNSRVRVNIPISSSLAITASAFMRENPGYVDNPFLGTEDVNKVHDAGGHLGLLWRPSEAFLLKINGLYQHLTGNGTNEVDLEPGLGFWQQTYIRGVGGYQRSSEILTATMTGTIGPVDMTSVTGYAWNGARDSLDGTKVGLGSILESGVLGPGGFPGYEVSGAPIYDNGHDSDLSQEIRLTVGLGKLVDLMIGGVYRYSYTGYSQTMFAADPQTGAVAGEALYSAFPTEATESAGFMNTTWHLTHRFDLQLGGREAHVKLTNLPQYNFGPTSGVFFGNADPTIPSSTPELVSNTNAFTYLIAPEFRFSDNLMIYMRSASSFRPGVSNAPFTGIPPQSDPDKTKDYEIGTKGSLFDQRITFDVSAYSIDWINLQLGLIDPNLKIQYQGNGGRAKSEGAEFSTSARLTKSLRLAGWISWNEAWLTEALPNSSLSPNVGQTLPWAPRFSGNLSLDEGFKVTSAVTGSIGASASYTGNRQDVFVPGTSARGRLPAYVRVDMRGSIDWDTWTMRLYVNNVGNRRGIISSENGALDPNGFFFIPPRSAGLSLSRTF